MKEERLFILYVILAFLFCKDNEEITRDSVWIQNERKWIDDINGIQYSSDGDILYFSKDGFYKKMNFKLNRYKLSDTLYIGSELMTSWFEGSWMRCGQKKIFAKSKLLYGFATKRIGNNYYAFCNKDSVFIDTFQIVIKGRKIEGEEYFDYNGINYKRYDKFTEGTSEILKMKYCEFVSSCGDEK